MWENNNYTLEVCLLSEAIFSSGEKESNLVQSKALTDADGFVYFHAKSLKGQLKRQALWLLRQYISFDKVQAVRFLDSIGVLFGLNTWELEAWEWDGWMKRNGGHSLREQGIIKFSHLELPVSVREHFRGLLDEDRARGYVQFSTHDLIEAQTHIRTGIQLEEGIVKNKMLNTYHTVKKGLVFYSTLSFDEDPAEHLSDLMRIVYSLNRIGANIHRGRGEIKARLLINGADARGSKILEGDGKSHGVLSGH